MLSDSFTSLMKSQEYRTECLIGAIDKDPLTIAKLLSTCVMTTLARHRHDALHCYLPHSCNGSTVSGFLRL